MTKNAEMFPVLRFENAEAAMTWLQEVLGFEAGMSVPDGKGGIAHAELALGDAGVMLGSLAKEPSDNAWSSVRHGL